MTGPCTHTPTSSLKAEVHVLLVCQAGDGNIQKKKPAVGGHKCQYLPANSKITSANNLRRKEEEQLMDSSQAWLSCTATSVIEAEAM
jgi:hypothetical protein